MDQFMVRDPGNRTDQEADDIYRETREQCQQCLNHPRIIDFCSGVFQVDVENEQGNREGDDTVAERFDSVLGHRATLFKRLNRNLTHAACMSWMARGFKIKGHDSYAQHVNLAVRLTNVAKESASIFRIMCARWI